MRTTALPLSLLLVILTTQSSFAKESRTRMVMETYTNKEAGVAIKYPADWTAIESEAGLVVGFYSQGSANANITIEYLSEPTTLPAYTKAALLQIKNALPNVRLLDPVRPAKLGGLRAQTITYTASEGDLKVKLRQIWTIRGETAYVLTFAASTKDFGKNQRIFQAMQRSFAFPKKNGQ